jgi:hypothetical protein
MVGEGFLCTRGERGLDEAEGVASMTVVGGLGDDVLVLAASLAFPVGWGGALGDFAMMTSASFLACSAAFLEVHTL